MGRKGRWFTTVKRVFRPHPKEKRGHKKRKSWAFGACGNPSFDEPIDDNLPATEAPIVTPSPLNPPSPAAAETADAKATVVEEVKAEEQEQDEHAYSVAVVAAVAAEAVAVVAEADADDVRLARFFSGRSKEEGAAMVIQTAFRGYLARRALRTLRGLARLDSLANGNASKRQTMNTLHCMQTLARVQSQIRSRRIRMTEENQALQRQLQVGHETELEKIKMGDEWDDSLLSKEQIEVHLVNKQEAAIRRERALAYAFSHQWKNHSRSANSVLMDPNIPQWGWSWLDRWMEARPWENRIVPDYDNAHSIGRDMAKVYARKDSISGRMPSRPPSRQSASMPSKALSVTGRSKPPSPRLDDSRSMDSFQSEKHRRRSSAVSSDQMTADRGFSGSAKRLSFPAAGRHNVPSSARIRRHSGVPNMDFSALKEVTI